MRLRLKFLRLLFILFMVGMYLVVPATAQPLQTPAPQPSTNLPSPVGDSNALITEVALLMVSVGGILAAVPEIVRAFRHDKDDDEEQARIILAMARVLAQEDQRRFYGGDEHRTHDSGPPGEERRHEE